MAVSKRTHGVTLDELQPGQQAVLRTCSAEGAVLQRLSEMGFVPGAGLRLVRRAPFGDPLEVQIGRSHLALRRADARSMEVELIDGEAS